MLPLWGSEPHGLQVPSKIGHLAVNNWAMREANRRPTHIKEHWD